IEGINADEANITSSALFLSSLPNVPSVELLPYHDIAIGKHARLGTIYNPLDYQMDIPSQTKIEKVISIFAEYGIKASV
ncbi:MAG: glycyl-radical enzyme activating protein, partial [Bacteroidales bacterium]|nr:glycyl-radical enzyme activating protein [Bacteroidales bacterium]